VLPDGTDVRHYPGAGDGLNELFEGPDGEIYATRYLGAAPGVAVFGPDGMLRREFVMPQEPGALTCPKSVAVDPTTREIWINTDIFPDDGGLGRYAAFRLSPEGAVLERTVRPTLVFLSFDAAGRGWFVDDDGVEWTLRIVEPGGRTRRVALGRHGPIDVVQDVKHAGDVTVLATWQRRVFAVRTSADGRIAQCEMPPPPLTDCASPALGYTAAVSARSGRVYETVDCDVRVARIGALDACDWREAP
jgi:hypothetical protein